MTSPTARHVCLGVKVPFWGIQQRKAGEVILNVIYGIHLAWIDTVEHSQIKAEIITEQNEAYHLGKRGFPVAYIT